MTGEPEKASRRPASEVTKKCGISELGMQERERLPDRGSSRSEVLAMCKFPGNKVITWPVWGWVVRAKALR